MKKRITIAQYQEANTKLVEERAKLTVERDEAIEREKDSKALNKTVRSELYEMLGGSLYNYGGGLSRNSEPSYMQIAKRAGELVATERFFHEMKKEMFGEEITISGDSIPGFLPAGEIKKRIVAEDSYHPPQAHIHEVSPKTASALGELADMIITDLKKDAKKRKARRDVARFAFLTAIIVAGILVGYFGAALIFG